MASRGAG